MAPNFGALRESFSSGGKVLLPGDEGFEDSLKRWSDTCIKPAVSVCSSIYPTGRLTKLTAHRPSRQLCSSLLLRPTCLQP